MAEENLQEPELDGEGAPEPEDSKKSAKKGGIMKYLLFGVIGLVVVVTIAFGTVFLMGGMGTETAEISAEDAASEGKHADTKGTDNTKHQSGKPESINEDSLLAQLEEDDAAVLEKIMDNLAFLDYEPQVEDMEEETGGMAVEDSIEAVNWFKQEETRLAEKEKELKTRERELNVLDKKVTQKLLKIEQAESTRISSLARLYDGMESRSVSQLMANLDDATVVSILPRMKQKNASQVLQLMPPKRAARLSKQMITIAEN